MAPKIKYTSTIHTLHKCLRDAQIGKDHIDALKMTPFYHFIKNIYDMRNEKVSRRLNKRFTRDIIMCYDVKTEKFRFGDTLVALTADDIRILFGIEEGYSPVEKFLKKTLNEQTTWQKRHFGENRKIVTKDIVSAIKKVVQVPGISAKKDFAKLITLLAFNTVFFCTSGDHVSREYLLHAENIVSSKDECWSELIHENLMKSIKDLKRTYPEKVRGCLVVLMPWCFELIKYAKPTYPHAFPRILKWKLSVRPKWFENIERIDSALIRAGIKPSKSEITILGLDKEVEESEEETNNEEETDNEEEESDEEEEGGDEEQSGEKEETIEGGGEEEEEEGHEDEEERENVDDGVPFGTPPRTHDSLDEIGHGDSTHVIEVLKKKVEDLNKMNAELEEKHKERELNAHKQLGKLQKEVDDLQLEKAEMNKQLELNKAVEQENWRLIENLRKKVDDLERDLANERVENSRIESLNHDIMNKDIDVLAAAASTVDTSCGVNKEVQNVHDVNVVDNQRKRKVFPEENSTVRNVKKHSSGAEKKLDDDFVEPPSTEKNRVDPFWHCGELLITCKGMNDIAQGLELETEVISACLLLFQEEHNLKAIDRPAVQVVDMVKCMSIDCMDVLRGDDMDNVKVMVDSPFMEIFVDKSIKFILFPVRTTIKGNIDHWSLLVFDRTAKDDRAWFHYNSIASSNQISIGQASTENAKYIYLHICGLCGQQPSQELMNVHLEQVNFPHEVESKDSAICMLIYASNIYEQGMVSSQFDDDVVNKFRAALYRRIVNDRDRLLRV